jgi:subtilase family serine protease
MRGRSELIEALERRVLLSAAVGAASTPRGVAHYDSLILKAAASGDIQRYTPAQVRHAYGFDQIAGDGAGQTIAIVDAFNDPNIANDLATFDSQFGLAAPPSFRVVNQTGGGDLPTTDSGWAGEISLDVEWAHAMAPAANILLVESNSDLISDLMAAVDYARGAAGVSVVSMSWGGSEFESFGGAEFSSQTDYDPFFTTPGGHQGVTFIASAGDTGVRAGAQWPSTSPNVLSVGGTSLFTADNAGTYSSESSWSGTSGGFSLYEAEPDYQQTAAAGVGVRTTPDVAYDGDPNTGFAVYDSLPDQGFVGWQEVAGTSAGAPQWAALVAIADQVRVSAGHGTLDGATGVLPTLYSVYSDPGTDGYANYTNYFNDVVDNSFRRHAHATEGYDILTGLGTPKVSAVVSLLGSTGDTSSGGAAGGGSVSLPPSPISGLVLSTPPLSVIGGTKGSVKVSLSNDSGSDFSGPVTVTVYASTQTTLDASATAITTLSLPALKLRAGDVVTRTIKFTYPNSLPTNNYYLIASTSATGTNTSPSNSVSPSVEIDKPAVDLATAFSKAGPITTRPGHTTSVDLTLQNLGNVAANGTWDLSLDAAPDGVLDGSEVLLRQVHRKISLGPGRQTTIHLHFKAPPDLSGGTYDLIATTSSATNPSDGNSSNDTAIIATRAPGG